jgi:predicted alpha-1,6-mannanase (GH76 family)
LFLLTAGRLHQRTADPGRRASGYLDWALREWQWFNASGLIGPAGLVNDGLTADCTNNGGTTWTYNQGVIIGGLTVLHDVTGDGAYLGQAEAIAVAALRDLTIPPGILADPGERPGKPGRSVGAGWSGKPGRSVGAGWSGKQGDQPQFKGIFIRNLYELYRHRPRAEYRDFILTNATSLWRNARNRRDQVGLAWAGPFDRADAARQGSALDALNAAVGVTGIATR